MSDGMTITMDMNLKPGMADAFIEGTGTLIEDTAQYPGFRSVRIVRHKDDDDHLLAIESWDSEADYLAYVAWRSDQDAVTEAAAMFATPPVVQVWPTEALKR